MITIDRTMSSAPLRDIEALPVLLFEGERYAHKFVIHPATGIAFAGMAVTARFITADETEEEIVAPGGQVVDGAAVVTLTPACYTVPGHFKFFIYVTDANRTVCVYACTGVVIPTVGANGTAGTSAGVIIEAYTAGAPLLDSLIPGKTAAFSDSASSASANFSVAIGYRCTASGIYSQAFGNASEAAGDSAHAEGWGSVARGQYSHAEGASGKAFGLGSHGEGLASVADGNGAHAEGEQCLAENSDSHAEGYKTEARGDHSHTEGGTTKTTGVNAHAEGYSTLASGEYAHAEGGGTVASGKGSHAEGFHTTASQEYQHVFGKYNVPDNDGVYAEIVGNGTPNGTSNARTLDWSGNEALAGSLTLGKGGSHENIISPRTSENLTVLISALSLIRVNLSIPEAIDRLVNMIENWNGGSFGDGSGNYGADHGATPATSLVYFYKHPKDRQVQAGKLTVMEVDVEGAESYQWQYSEDSGTTWTDCGSGFTGPKTTRVLYQATEAMNGWKFRCRAIGAKGTITVYSREATLTVTAAS